MHEIDTFYGFVTEVKIARKVGAISRDPIRTFFVVFLAFFHFFFAAGEIQTVDFTSVRNQNVPNAGFFALYTHAFAQKNICVYFFVYICEKKPSGRGWAISVEKCTRA